MTKRITKILASFEGSPISVGDIIYNGPELGIVEAIEFICDPEYDESYMVSFVGETHTLEVFKPLWVLREDK